MFKMLLVVMLAASSGTALAGEAEVPISGGVTKVTPENKNEEAKETPKPEPAVHEVVAGDTLTKIGEPREVPWKRLWDANTQLADPDVIHVGDKIRIPEADEVIAERALPAPPAAAVQTMTAAAAAAPAPARAFTPSPARIRAYGGASGLLGSIGRALPYGNCVLEPGVNNPGWGTPISWPVTSRTPWIGATALFPYNHAGVVVGIWPNGDVEIRHQNYKGTQTRFSASSMRGFR